jgi:hypothetical protein
VIGLKLLFLRISYHDSHIRKKGKQNTDKYNFSEPRVVVSRSIELVWRWYSIPKLGLSSCNEKTNPILIDGESFFINKKGATRNHAPVGP